MDCMDRLKIIDGIRDLGLSVLPTGAKLVLFGSQARNDARSDSEWDLLILIDGQKVSKADFENYAYPCIEWGWDVNADINPLIYTYSDWKKRSITPFYKNIAEEGVVLCS